MFLLIHKSVPEHVGAQAPDAPPRERAAPGGLHLRGKILHTRNQHLRNHRGLSVAFSHGLSVAFSNGVSLCDFRCVIDT